MTWKDLTYLEQITQLLLFSHVGKLCFSKSCDISFELVDNALLFGELNACADIVAGSRTPQIFVSGE